MHAVFLGRFQPFHNGHIDAIHNILKDCDRLTIIIGSSEEEKTEKNPFNIEQRVSMVQSIFPELEIAILPDNESDDIWIKNLQSMVEDFDILYSGNKNVLHICKLHNIECKQIKFNIDISATKIRQKMQNNENISEHVSQEILDIIYSS